MKRKKLPFEKAIEHYKNTSLSYYYEWKKYENFQFSYEGYMKNKQKYIKYILNIIKIKLNNQEIKELLNDCEKLKENLIKINGKFEKSNYNITYMTNSHSTSGGQMKKYIKFFNQKEKDILLKDKLIKKYLKDNEYI